MTELHRTGLYDLHVELGAKMVPFAGYEMPVQYPLGVMGEHLQTRDKAGLFDVSHMGQVLLRPKSGSVEEAARALETLVPADLIGLPPGRQRYGVFTNDAGGILDDLMIANRGDHLFLVVNAACKTADLAHLGQLSGGCDIEEVTDRALLALQGPSAEAVLMALVPALREMRFMDVDVCDSDWGPLWVSRSGYTGEDGFEISVSGERAEGFARAVLGHEDVAPVGLGARDSLRLEAGLCLYGADLDETTTPVEGNIAWSIQKVRRKGGDREGGFPGADRIIEELARGPARLRVGLLPEGRAPMRAGTPLFGEEEDTEPMGEITSGGFGPSVGRPISMGYVKTAHAALGTPLWAELRGKRLPVTVAELPFRPATYKR